ncbi:MAG TPA: hypothetical protein PKA58_14010, partial [Polyangium sp.]|nr:hypothetical protein [Polyangium sp.]
PTPSPSASAADPNVPSQTAADPFANMPPLRSTLGAYQPAPGPVFEGASLYVALGAPPFAFALFSAGAAGARKMRQRRAAGAVSPEKLAATALDEATKARASGDTKAVCAAIERAMHHALKAATDLESRGILLDELTDELEEAGLVEDLATRTKALFEEISALRYDPDATDASVEDLLTRGRKLVRELLDAPRESA